MTETKHFDLGDILTVTSGLLVSTRHMEGVYDILNWMSKESLFTHQLPRVLREAKPVLLALHPQLADVSLDNPNNDWGSWLVYQKSKYGETLPIRRLTENEHERIEPLSELVELTPPDKIVIINSKEKSND